MGRWGVKASTLMKLYGRVRESEGFMPRGEAGRGRVAAERGEAEIERRRTYLYECYGVVEHDCVTPAVVAAYALETDGGSRCICELSNLVRPITGQYLPSDSDIAQLRVKTYSNIILLNKVFSHIEAKT